MRLVVVAGMLLAAAPATAQTIELAALVNYSTSSALDRTAEGVDRLEIDDGLTWGAHGTYFFANRVGVEGMWTYQSPGLLLTSAASTAEVFRMEIAQLTGNLVYQFAPVDARVQPFVFGGAGVAFLEAPDLERERKPAWNLGAGLKWFLQQRLGLEGRFRYQVTELGDTDDEACGPFGFCHGALRRVDIGVGAIFRF